MRPRIPKGKKHIVEMSQWDRKVLKAAFKVMEGEKRNNKIAKETKLHSSTVKRIRLDLDYQNVIQLKNKHSKFLLSPERIEWVKNFYKDLTNCGYSIADLISQYQIEFPKFSIKPSTARHLIKMEGIRYYNTKWAPPRIKQINESKKADLDKAARIAINLVADLNAWPVWIDEWEVHDSKVPVRCWCSYYDLEFMRALEIDKKGKFYIISAYDWAGLAASMVFRTNISTVEYSMFINELIGAYANVNSSQDTWQNRMRSECLKDTKIKIYHDNAPCNRQI